MINNYIWPMKMEIKNNNTLVIDCSDAGKGVQVEFNVNDYTIKKVK